MGYLISGLNFLTKLNFCQYNFEVKDFFWNSTHSTYGTWVNDRNANTVKNENQKKTFYKNKKAQ